MDIKFSKDSGDSHPQDAPGEKKNQRALLLLLLILVGGFTYLYFFTDLIKPLEVQKAAETTPPAPQIVKIPLPLREGEPAKPDAKAPEKTEAPKAAATPAAKPAPAPPKLKEEPKKGEAAKPAEKKLQAVTVTDKKGDKVTVTKGEEKRTAAAAKKPVVAVKKNVPAKHGMKKPTSGGQVKPVTAAMTKKATTDSWSLVVGNYVLEEALSADMGRVRKAGFVPVIKPSTRKKTDMSRLFVSEFNDRAAAQSTLEKLKRHTSDAFVIEQGGRFVVYAGSYLQTEAVNSEKERLKGAGFATTIRHAEIAIPSNRLSIGPFKSKKEADAALGRLRSAGIKALPSLN